MGEKIFVGDFKKGFKNDLIPTFIDNDSFPTLLNAYQWRGRVKRKRGTALLNRLQRFFNSTISSYSNISSITLDGAGNGNLVTGFALEANANIIPGSVMITGVVSMIQYTDPAMNGTLSPSGTINYASGAIQIAAEAGNAVNAIFSYYPDLPVMGLEDLILEVNQFPANLAFDTTYSYNILTTIPNNIYNVSFYKNLPSGAYTSYVQKTNWTPTTWNGQNYQQFWTVNYLGALWATNGINIPFNPASVGMQFVSITSIAAPVVGPPASATITTSAPHGLVIGDFVFINEVNTAVITGINLQTGYVTAVPSNTQITVTFPNATLGGAGGSTPGIVQYLTNRFNPNIDCLRWYDGDPTNGNVTTPAFATGKGWVNFAPPLSLQNFPIADQTAAVYYLVGARMIFPFKDRLLFFGPVIQTSAPNSQIYLQDTVIYSQNGTPYYTACFTGVATSATTVFNALLVPPNQTASPVAYVEDTTGFGGFISAGVDKPITTVSPNEDVLIVGFDNNLQTRLVYSGNDLVPFNFFIINSELGSASTFSIINMDQGVITRGNRGFILTSQTSCQRFDLDIPDEVFEINLSNNGTERFTAQRDFIDEWIYFTFNNNNENSTFPNQTLFYNYRDNSWGIFYENYTTYGLFRQRSGLTWATVGNYFPTWEDWNEPWNAGASTVDQQQVIAGNQQGFVLIRQDDTTGEATSLYIQNISGGTITCPNHGLNQNDFIMIQGCLGTIANQVNKLIFSVDVVDANSFNLNPAIGSGTYLGGGLITRFYIPFIQTKQFPISWNFARKTRLGPQQYLLTTTSNAQVQLLIYLSQDGNNSYNNIPIAPPPYSVNNSLIYSTVLYTCPESTNLGLTAANINLNMVTAVQQSQTWHRMNTSLIGDSVQVAITLSDSQMRSYTQLATPLTITGATNANPCVLTCNNTLAANQYVLIQNVQGMTQLNNNVYIILSATTTSINIGVDSTTFGTYVSGGTVTLVGPVNQTSEIELHGFILDVSPSQVLA